MPRLLTNTPSDLLQSAQSGWPCFFFDNGQWKKIIRKSVSRWSLLFVRQRPDLWRPIRWDQWVGVGDLLARARGLLNGFGHDGMSAKIISPADLSIEMAVLLKVALRAQWRHCYV